MKLFIILILFALAYVLLAVAIGQTFKSRTTKNVDDNET